LLILFLPIYSSLILLNIDATANKLMIVARALRLSGFSAGVRDWLLGDGVGDDVTVGDLEDVRDDIIDGRCIRIAAFIPG
jgi:hypothetical protein